MSDPAEIAANRVALQVESRIFYHHMLDSAREALAPIRAVLDKLAEDTTPPCDLGTEFELYREAISALSPLCYTSEELRMGP